VENITSAWKIYPLKDAAEPGTNLEVRQYGLNKAFKHGLKRPAYFQILKRYDSARAD